MKVPKVYSRLQNYFYIKSNNNKIDSDYLSVPCAVWHKSNKVGVDSTLLVLT